MPRGSWLRCQDTGNKKKQETHCQLLLSIIFEWLSFVRPTYRLMECRTSARLWWAGLGAAAEWRDVAWLRVPHHSRRAV